MTFFARLFARTEDFQKRKFPKQSLAAKLTHLAHEVQELRDAPDDLTEYADVLILVCGCAAKRGFTAQQLLDAAHNKMDVNNLRKWSPADAHGVHHHLEVQP